MKSNYSKFISVTLVLVVMLVVFAFPTPVYAGAKPPYGEQSAYAVFENNGGDVGTQIGSDNNSPVTVDQDQYIFVCIQQDFTQALKDHDMANQWRTWGGTWQTMAVNGTGSSTDWEYWDSNYPDRAENAVSDHFGDTAQGNYMWESDYPAFSGGYPPGEVTGKHETWLVVQAPNDAGRYELRWYDNEGGVGMTPTVMVDITVVIPGAPLVSTQAASSIGDNSATLNGNITDTGGSDVTERGFDWGLTDSYGSSWTETPGPYGTGTYNHGISGLDTGTLYHFRAKCYNSSGWTYGTDTEFTTTGLPSHPYLQIVQTCPEKGDAPVWWEWIVVNPTDSSKTLTEVRVKQDGVDWNWTIETQGYPTSGWADGGADGIYWSGSESIPARSATLFRVRAINEDINTDNDRTMTWSADVTGESVPDRTSTVVGRDKSATGGLFYNKPGDTTEQTVATNDDGLYTYLYEDSSNNPLEAGTQYTFYVNVHEWFNQGNMNGTLDITIPEEFTNVALVDYTDFSNANLSGGSGSDWTISGTNDVAIKNSVDHLSFQATTPAGYGVNTQWEFDTRFTGTGGKEVSGVDYITEANVLVQVTWESYNDAAHQNQDDLFDQASEDTAYMFGKGFVASTAYHAAYYDGDDAKLLSDGVSSTSSGNLSSLCYFPTYQGSAVAGTWHSVVYKDDVASPPATYIASDPDSVVEDDFEVTAEAIPEFPTVISAIAVAGVCFGVYYWMRRRKVHVKA